MKRILVFFVVLALMLPTFAFAYDIHEHTANNLPLTDEPVTLKMWFITNTTVSQYYSDYAELPFFKEMEARTGVHIDFELVSASSPAEAFNLMIASGDLPDIVECSESFDAEYDDGLDAAVDDGYFLDLTLYLDNLASDYQAACTIDEETSRQTSTDSGRVVGFWQTYVFGYQPPWDGMFVRKDWLDKVGLAAPVTYDDWHTMLKAFKEQLGADAALQIGSDGTVFMNTLSAGYGASDTFQVKDKKIQYGPIMDGWREYLTMMNQWYKEGLINPDFLSATSKLSPNNSLIAANETGATPGIYVLVDVYNSQVEGADFIPVSTPVKQAGDTVYLGLNIAGTGAGNYTVISADTKYPELCVKWLNYLYTYEGWLLSTYGIEGKTFEFDENGSPRYTDYMTKNENGTDFSTMVNTETLMPSLGCAYDWTRETQVLSDDVLACLDVWSANYVKERTQAYLMPSGVAMTQAENAEYAAIMADIKTYVTENTTKFITGERALDEWDSYVSDINGMNIDGAISLYQAALDRYYAK